MSTVAWIRTTLSTAFFMQRARTWADHSLPSTHLGLSATALVVAAGFLPCHPPFGLDFCNMAIADRWNQHRLRAGNG
ncbi:hypothetical protein, partial [Sinorhizobium meliloti]|uniref:hypothetical protein n=1 Tax=Rhizobium meliloti TaxID=382 RepID=UPI001AEC7B2E